MDPNKTNQDQTANPANSTQADITQSDATQQNPTQTDNAQSDTSQQDGSQTTSDTTTQDTTSTQPTEPDTTAVQGKPSGQEQLSTQPGTEAATQSDQNVDQPQQTTASSESVAPTSPVTSNTTQNQGNYIEDVGEDLIDLLDEISEDENLLKAVADEMQLDKERVKGILTGLLTKIDQGQITDEELALIMASTVADEVIQNE